MRACWLAVNASKRLQGPLGPFTSFTSEKGRSMQTPEYLKQVRDCIVTAMLFSKSHRIHGFNPDLQAGNAGQVPRGNAHRTGQF